MHEAPAFVRSGEGQPCFKTMTARSQHSNLTMVPSLILSFNSDCKDRKVLHKMLNINRLELTEHELV